LLGAVGVVVAVAAVVAAAVVVVEDPMEVLDERSGVRVAPSWFSDFQSYQAEHADLGVAASGAELGFATSTSLAERSWMGDAVVAGAAVADAAHTMGQSGAATGGIAVEDRHSTSGSFVATAMLARHTFCVDHVQRATRLMLGSWTVGYGRKLVGMVASFARQP
jgi:hypothetical protein